PGSAARSPRRLPRRPCPLRPPMSRRHQRCLVPVVRGPHWHGLGPHDPAAAPRPSRCYFQPCPYHRLRPGRRPTTTATFVSSRFSRHRHSLSAPPPRAPPVPACATPHAHPYLSRPVEDCDGSPALAGIRHLGLDDPSAGRP